MTTDPGTDAETFPYEVCGRTLTCRYMTDAQRLMLRRLVGQWQQADERQDEEEMKRRFEEMNIKTLTVIESLIVDPGDVAFLEEQMLLGKVKLKDLRPIIAGGTTEDPAPPEDDQPPKPRKAASKAPKKPVKKTVARASRVKK